MNYEFQIPPPSLCQPRRRLIKNKNSRIIKNSKKTLQE